MTGDGSKGNTEAVGIIAEHLDSLGSPVILGEDLMIRDMGFGVPDMGVRRTYMDDRKNYDIQFLSCTG